MWVYDLWNLSFLIPPLPEKEIPLINDCSHIVIRILFGDGSRL